MISLYAVSLEGTGEHDGGRRKTIPFTLAVLHVFAVILLCAYTLTDYFLHHNFLLYPFYNIIMTWAMHTPG